MQSVRTKGRGIFLRPANLALLGTLLLGAALQTVVGIYEWANWDEGEYLQGALAVVHGGIPLVTFSSRVDPLSLYLLAPGVFLFGGTLGAAIGTRVVFDTATAAVLALLARRMALRNAEVVAIAAAGVYLLAPAVVDLVTRVAEEPLAALFLSLSLYFLLRDRWRSWGWNLPVSGFLLGLAILTRRSEVVVGIAWLLWIFTAATTWRERVMRSLRCFLPGIALVLGFYFYVASQTSLAWGLSSMVKDPYLPFGQRVVAWPVIGEEIGYLMVVAAPLFLAPLALLIRHLRSRVSARLVRLVSLLTSIAVVVLLALLPYEFDYGVGEYPTASLAYLLLVSGAVWFLLLTLEVGGAPSVPAGRSREMLLLGGWAASVELLDFSIRPQAFVAYAADAFAPLALLFGFWYAGLLPPPSPQVPAPSSSNTRRVRETRWRSKVGGLAAITLLVVSSALTAVLVLGPTNPYNVPGASNLPLQGVQVYPPSEVTDVATALKTLVRQGGPAFSFDTPFLSAADVQNTPQISMYLDPYLSLFRANVSANTPLYPGAPEKFAPSLDQLLALWNSTHLRWVVEGPLTLRAESYSPLLAWYFDQYFYPIQSFGDPLSYDSVEILERGNPPQPNMTLKETQSTPGQPAYLAVSSNGTVFTGSLNSTYLYYTLPSGASGLILTPFSGVRSVSCYGSEIWVGSARTPQVAVLSMSGGTPEILSSGSGPSAIIFDPGLGMSFVSSLSSQRVTAFREDNSTSSWNFAWNLQLNSPISGLALDPAIHLLFAASPSTDEILALNETSGALLHGTLFPFAPFALLYADGGLVTSWTIGDIYRLSPDPQGGLVVTGSTQVGLGVTALSLDPATDSIVVPSEKQNTVSLLGAQTLLPLGEFSGVPCPSAAVMSGGLVLATSNLCANQTTFWHVPPPAHVTLRGNPAGLLTLDGQPLAQFHPPVSLEMWPQTLEVSVTAPGYLPGYHIVSVEESGGWLNFSTNPGPSLEGIRSLQQVYTVEIAGFSAIVLGLATCLLLIPRSEASGKDSPPREPPAPKDQT